MARVALLTVSDGRDFVAVATSSARRLAGAEPDLMIFHQMAWSFPDFTMLAASATSGPLKPPG